MRKIKVEPLNGHEENIEDIFEEYLDICNQAIKEHKDEFPYKGIMRATEALLGTNSIDLVIYDDLPKVTYSLILKNKRLVSISPRKGTKEAWKMNLSYLKKVVEHQDEYLSHPEKLDLDWLKNRMGF